MDSKAYDYIGLEETRKDSGPTAQCKTACIIFLAASISQR